MLFTDIPSYAGCLSIALILILGFLIALSPLLTVTGFEFFEASAKDNINVKQTFERLVDIICDRMSENLESADPSIVGNKQGPQLNEQPQRSTKDCAC